MKVVLNIFILFKIDNNKMILEIKFIFYWNKKDIYFKIVLFWFNKEKYMKFLKKLVRFYYGNRIILFI